MENRTIVGPGFDRALARIDRDIRLDIHQIPSGEHAWTWPVPNAWSVREAWFGADGTRYADFDRHPLYLWSFSLPFRGRVTRDELLRHVTTNPDRPDAIPFDFRYYQRDWGFSLEHSRLRELTADEYDVVIDVVEEPGALKIGEHVIPGETEDSILVVAHLCHPGQANDDLAGVAVSVEVARRLQARQLHHTVRFLYLPEQIGSIAYLALNEERLSRFRFGIFLEMLGIAQPLALQHSKRAASAVDRAALLALRETGRDFLEGDFLKVIVNDEQVLDGPGVDIPTISLSRATPPPAEGAEFARYFTGLPYPEYHTSDDSLAIIDDAALEEAAAAAVRTIEIVDRDRYPRRLFRGTVHLSSYGLWVDWRVDPLLSEQVHHFMWSFEGDKSLSQIAMETGLPFDTVADYVGRFEAAGLVELRHEPWDAVER